MYCGATTLLLAGILAVSSATPSSSTTQTSATPATTSATSHSSATAPSSSSSVDSSTTATSNGSSSSSSPSTPSATSEPSDTLTTNPPSSTTPKPDACYNYTCSNNTCLSDAIDDPTVNVDVCPRGDGYCQIRRVEKDSDITIEAKCVDQTCSYSKQESDAAGTITTNCCSSDLCNVESILKGDATTIRPSVFALLCVALGVTVFGL